MTILSVKRGALLILVVAATGLTSFGASVGSVGRFTATSAQAAPRLVAIRAAHRAGYDRVVFDFAGGLPTRRNVRYVRHLIADPSGSRVRIAGRAILEASFFPATARNAAGHWTAPERVAFALPGVMTAVRAGDFEAVLSYGLGLARQTPFHVFTLTHPSRVVIDIRTPFRTVFRRVYFENSRHFSAGIQPYVTAVLRPVIAATPATGVMDRLFAGPTPGEYAAGLRLQRSRATGFADLTIRDPIARVRLTGGCRSGGSTFTIADEIFPTLKRFANVSHVKIYDPAGHTEAPSGQRDSIPTCLEP